MGFIDSNRALDKLGKSVKELHDKMEDFRSRVHPNTPSEYADGVQRAIDSCKFEIWDGAADSFVHRRIDFQKNLYNSSTSVYGIFHDMKHLEKFAMMFNEALDMGLEVKIRVKSLESDNRCVQQLKEAGVIEKFDNQKELTGYIILFDKSAMMIKPDEGNKVIISVNRQLGDEETIQGTNHVYGWVNEAPSCD